MARPTISDSILKHDASLRNDVHRGLKHPLGHRRHIIEGRVVSMSSEASFCLENSCVLAFHVSLLKHNLYGSNVVLTC